jgi:NAD(P)H-hydrate epimerase
LAPEDAMKLAVYLHGLAGDLVASKKGEVGLIATDVIEELPCAMRELRTTAA